MSSIPSSRPRSSAGARPPPLLTPARPSTASPCHTSYASPGSAWSCWPGSPRTPRAQASTLPAPEFTAALLSLRNTLGDPCHSGTVTDLAPPQQQPALQQQPPARGRAIGDHVGDASWDWAGPRHTRSLAPLIPETGLSFVSGATDGLTHHHRRESGTLVIDVPDQPPAAPRVHHSPASVLQGWATPGDGGVLLGLEQDRDGGDAWSPEQGKKGGEGGAPELEWEDVELQLLLSRLSLYRAKRHMAAVHCAKFTAVLQASLASHGAAHGGGSQGAPADYFHNLRDGDETGADAGDERGSSEEGDGDWSPPSPAATFPTSATYAWGNADDHESCDPSGGDAFRRSHTCTPNPLQGERITWRDRRRSAERPRPFPYF